MSMLMHMGTIVEIFDYARTDFMDNDRTTGSWPWPGAESVASQAVSSRERTASRVAIRWPLGSGFEAAATRGGKSNVYIHVLRCGDSRVIKSLNRPNVRTGGLESLRWGKCNQARVAGRSLTFRRP